MRDSGARHVLQRIDAVLDAASRMGLLRTSTRFCVSADLGLYCTLSPTPSAWGDVSLLAEQLDHVYDWTAFPRGLRRILSGDPTPIAVDLCAALDRQLQVPVALREHRPPPVASFDVEDAAREAIEDAIDVAGVDTILAQPGRWLALTGDAFQITTLPSAHATPLVEHLHRARYINWCRTTSGEADACDAWGWSPLDSVVRRAVNAVARTTSMPIRSTG